MNHEQKQIGIYVAYKGVIELVKTGKIDLNKTVAGVSTHQSIFEHYVLEHFEMLERLCEQEATESQVNYLKDLIDTCTLEDKQLNDIKLKIHRGLTYIQFTEILEILKENQQEGNLNMGDIGRKLDEKMLDEKA